MPRVAPTLYRRSSRPTTASTSRSPRPSCASSTARTGCASTAPAPASRCSSTRSASTTLREQVEEELKGDWVAERDFDPSRRSSSTTRRPTRPAPPVAYGSPNGDLRGVRAASAPRTSIPQRQEGFSAVQVKVTRGDLTPEQFRGLATIMREFSRRLRPHDRAPEPRPALGARRVGLRRLARAAASSASATPAPTRSTTSSRAPAPTPASSASPARWGSTTPCSERIEAMGDRRPADPRHPHQDVRLPERLQPAPHRQHRVLRRVDQGRRAHDPRLRRAHRRQVRGRRDRLRARA